jgi:mono/diheme cytochrome c family protein
MNRMVIAILVAFACMAANRSASAQTPAELGAKVYAEQKCSVCHAIEGKGNPKGPLNDIGSKRTAEEIRQWIVSPVEMAKTAGAKRKPAMKAYPKLSKEHVDALVAYMLTLKAK